VGGDEPLEGLSRGHQLLWGLRERPRKGPKPGLSLERVVTGAIEVADSEGLAAVSMSRVAEQVGYTTMSLYRYVGGKDELLDLMMDAAIGTPSPAVREGGWRARMERWSWEQLAVCRRHPWIVQIPITQLPISPNQLAWMETALDAFAETTLTSPEKLGLVSLCQGFIRHESQLFADLHRTRRERGVSEAEMNAAYGRMLARLADPERYPTLHQMAVSGMFEGPDFAGAGDGEPGGAEVGPATEPDFDFGLQRVLDGLEAYVRSRG
jgi:AcrR family transcriptional regulator